MKNTLSLTLIVKNEAHHLPQALKYAHIFADEIIIIDTGSTDNTKEIARKYTEKVYDYKWINDFSAARNFGISKCTKDFVIWLDADDYISQKDSQAVSKLMTENIGWDLCFLPYHYTYGHQGNSRLLFYRERIFRNHIGVHFQYPIHECLVIPEGLKTTNYKDVTIYHKTISRWEDNSTRNTKILLDALKTKKYSENFRFWWLLGREYAANEDNCKAIEISLKGISLLKEKIGKQASQQYVEISVLYTREKQYTQALDFAAKSIAAYNLWREPFFEAGRALWYMDRYKEALQMFNLATHIKQPTDASSIDLGLYAGPLLYDWLSLTYDRLDDYQKSLYYVNKALRYTPNDERLIASRLYWEEKIRNN